MILRSIAAGVDLSLPHLHPKSRALSSRVQGLSLMIEGGGSFSAAGPAAQSVTPAFPSAAPTIVHCAAAALASSHPLAPSATPTTAWPAARRPSWEETEVATSSEAPPRPLGAAALVELFLQQVQPSDHIHSVICDHHPAEACSRISHSPSTRQFHVTLSA